jgi:hypothetical protein
VCGGGGAREGEFNGIFTQQVNLEITWYTRTPAFRHFSVRNPPGPLAIPILFS